jgi:phenylalanyl-tRNA synthetase beta chain
MNILIPHSWLLEHLETDATPTEIQKYLSLCGPSVERIYDREGEEVYDIEVTTNRVDCMSVRGIAHEAAVILPQFGKSATLKNAKLPAVPGVSGSELPLPKIVENAELCPRTLCVVLADAERATTPEWMAKRLRQIDQTVHDAVIDITNYVTHELGHPCHAFDYNAIMKLGGEVRVELAKAGLSFKTLDGVEYTTKGGEIVFVNPAGEIIDLPGIKGTANSAINDHTKNVLFWLESIDPKRVRQASMGHAIRTVAAQLNEKKVDPHLALDVFQRGVQLFQELTGARVASEVVDAFPHPAQPSTVSAPASEFSRYLGIELPAEKITEIFEKLGCDVETTGNGGETIWSVTPPTYRPDLEISADLVEEVARIYGYHNLPSVVMDTQIPLNPSAEYRPDLEQRLKRFLAARGWYELYTYSFVSAELAEASGYPVAEHLKVQNPLTEDKVYLRRSLLPSLRDVVEQNLERPLQVFECANVYHPVADGIPANIQYVGIVSTHSYRAVVGELQALLTQFFVTDLQVEPLARFHHSSLVSS